MFMSTVPSFSMPYRTESADAHTANAATATATATTHRIVLHGGGR